MAERLGLMCACVLMLHRPRAIWLRCMLLVARRPPCTCALQAGVRRVPRGRAVGPGQVITGCSRCCERHGADLAALPAGRLCRAACAAWGVSRHQGARVCAWQLPEAVIMGRCAAFRALCPGALAGPACVLARLLVAAMPRRAAGRGSREACCSASAAGLLRPQSPICCMPARPALSCCALAAARTLPRSRCCAHAAVRTLSHPRCYMHAAACLLQRSAALTLAQLSSGAPSAHAIAPKPPVGSLHQRCIA